MNLKDAVNLAIWNIQKESITDVDVFTRPFEIDYLSKKENRTTIYEIVLERITNALKVLDKNKTPFDALKELKLSPIRTILIPKKNLFDFRKCSYTEPIDEIVYLSLVLMISNRIEKKRINRNECVIYSYRLRNDLLKIQSPNYLFDFNYSFTPFRSSLSKNARKYNSKVIISCDISNFYDRLNLHRLENSLLAIPDIDKRVVQLLNQVLLFWSDRDSYGLPVGSNASRILAEASLIAVDKYLLDKGIKFTRFVDDYKIFARDAKQAHSWLSILVERLNQEGLFLNTSKTKILSYNELSKDQKDESSTKNDSEMERSELPQVIRGYSGIIPTKFRQLSQHEKSSLKALNIDSFYNEKISNDLIEPSDLQKYLRTLVAQKEWERLAFASKLLNRFPQFIPYYLDCVSKHEEQLCHWNNDIENEIIELCKDETLLEYLRVYLFRFLSRSEDGRKILLHTYLNLKRGEGVYLGRSILESIFKYVNRDSVLEIKKSFQRADNAEKRIILRMMHYELNDSEFDVFVKNISLNNNDPFIELIVREEIKDLSY